MRGNARIKETVIMARRSNWGRIPIIQSSYANWAFQPTQATGKIKTVKAPVINMDPQEKASKPLPPSGKEAGDEWWGGYNEPSFTTSEFHNRLQHWVMNISVCRHDPVLNILVLFTTASNTWKTKINIFASTWALCVPTRFPIIPWKLTSQQKGHCVMMFATNIPLQQMRGAASSLQANLVTNQTWPGIADIDIYLRISGLSVQSSRIILSPSLKYDWIENLEAYEMILGILLFLSLE